MSGLDIRCHSFCVFFQIHSLCVCPIGDVIRYVHASFQMSFIICVHYFRCHSLCARLPSPPSTPVRQVRQPESARVRHPVRQSPPGVRQSPPSPPRVRQSPLESASQSTRVRQSPPKESAMQSARNPSATCIQSAESARVHQPRRIHGCRTLATGL